MNWIVCDEHCRHQQEGYCTLNEITRLTKDTRAKCGYFEDVETAAASIKRAGEEENHPST